MIMQTNQGCIVNQSIPIQKCANDVYPSNGWQNTSASDSNNVHTFLVQTGNTEALSVKEHSETMQKSTQLMQLQRLPSQQRFQPSQQQFQPSRQQFQPSNHHFQPLQHHFQPSHLQFRPSQQHFQPSQQRVQLLQQRSQSCQQLQYIRQQLQYQRQQQQHSSMQSQQRQLGQPDKTVNITHKQQHNGIFIQESMEFLMRHLMTRVSHTSENGVTFNGNNQHPNDSLSLQGNIQALLNEYQKPKDLSSDGCKRTVQIPTAVPIRPNDNQIIIINEKKSDSPSTSDQRNLQQSITMQEWLSKVVLTEYFKAAKNGKEYLETFHRNYKKSRHNSVSTTNSVNDNDECSRVEIIDIENYQSKTSEEQLAMNKWYKEPSEEKTDIEITSKKRKNSISDVVEQQDSVAKSARLDDSSSSSQIVEILTDMHVDGKSVEHNRGVSNDSSSQIVKILSNPDNSSDKIVELLNKPDYSTDKIVETLSNPDNSSDKIVKTLNEPDNSDRIVETLSDPDNSSEKIVETLNNAVNKVRKDNTSNVENNRHLITNIQKDKCETDSNIMHFMEVMSVNSPKFMIFFHGRNILCLSKQKSKFVVLRELIFHFFKDTITLVKSTLSELGIMKKMLSGKEKEEVAQYLCHRKIFSDKTTKQVGIIQIEDANRLYHTLSAQNKCDICVKLAGQKSPCVNVDIATLSDHFINDSNPQAGPNSDFSTLSQKDTNCMKKTLTDASSKESFANGPEDGDSDSTVTNGDDDGREKSNHIHSRESSNDEKGLITAGVIELGGNLVRYICRKSILFVPVKDINRYFSMDVINRTLKSTACRSTKCRDTEHNSFLQFDNGLDVIVPGDILVDSRILEHICIVESEVKHSLPSENDQPSTQATVIEDCNSVTPDDNSGNKYKAMFNKFTSICKKTVNKRFNHDEHG